MRLLLLAVCFYGVICSVLSATVSDGTPSVTIQALPSVYNVGETRAIYCEGKNLPQKLEWFYPSGERVKERSIHNTRVRLEKVKNFTNVAVLVIDHLKIEDSGNWTCSAGDELKQTIEIYVGEKVKFQDHEVDVYGEEDKSVQLDCEAKGYPDPVVQWFKDNSFIEADGKKISIKERKDSHELEIRNLNYLDPGTYMCRATQDRLSHFAQKKFNLRVRHKPVITNVFNQTTRVAEEYVIMNKTKKIKCGAIAYPPPKFSWSKQDKNNFYKVIEGEDSVYTAEDSTYSILTLNVEDETVLGQYKCSVINDRDRTTILFHVTLGNKPSPPSAAGVKKAEAHNITFNVSCPSCVFWQDDVMAQNPENLTVTGFTFQLVPCTSGVAVPNWQNAETYDFTVSNETDLEFTVTNLQNSTEYHAQVATRNDAGLSDWLAVHPNPKTTDAAAALTTSLTLLFIAFITTLY